MSENASENGGPKRSIVGEVLSLVEDQVELASLELNYEKSQSLRRLAAYGIAAALGLTAFALLQITIVLGLQAAGLSLWGACLLLAAVYAVGAGALIWKFSQRDERVGEPFQGSRAQMRKNLQWIHQFFS